MSENKAAAELFLTWATFWRPPDAEFWQSVSDGSVDTHISGFVTAAAYSDWTSSERFQSQLPSLSALQYFFVRCFIGIGKKSVLPVESVYKKWTEDTTTRLPIAGSTGYLMGDAALHARYLMDHYGLSVPPDYRMMPDHLTLLLELASYVLENRTQEEAQLFLSQHLDWLEKFASALQETEVESELDQKAKNFYQLTLQLLQQTVDCQLMKYSNNTKTN